jgi:hypothetical protein
MENTQRMGAVAVKMKMRLLEIAVARGMEGALMVVAREMKGALSMEGMDVEEKRFDSMLHRTLGLGLH